MPPRVARYLTRSAPARTAVVGEVLVVEEHLELLEVGAAQIVMPYDFDALIQCPRVDDEPEDHSRRRLTPTGSCTTATPGVRA
ncbi:hypothetical protein DOT90_15520 [Clavibacter michiganensis subsp. michiganensis]|nr:hypothetical protein [Clavibacter michiganensis subsp. michiganensis]